MPEALIALRPIQTINHMHPLIDLKYVFLPGHHPKLYYVWALCSSLKDTYEHIVIIVYIKSTVTDCL